MFFSSIGQNVSLDTLSIEKMISNIPIVGRIEHLFFILDKPKQTYCTFNKNVRSVLFDDRKKNEYLVNTIGTLDGSLQYYEKNGRIRLYFVDFKYCTNIYIRINDLTLSRNLTLAELMKNYNYTDSDIAGPQLGIMAPYETSKKDRFYKVDFTTGESKDVRIELYFDKKKKLRCMYITIFYL